MDTRYLKFFLKCAETGSITAAAHKLIMSQQGVSAALSRLEAELGCTLFERAATGVVLTEAGRYLLPRAERILAIVAECENHFSGAERRETLAVGCSFGVVGILWDGVLAEFQRDNPDLELAIHEFPDLACDQALARGDIEVALVCGQPDGHAFTLTPLFTREMCLLIHAAHPLADRGSVTIAELRDEPVVILNRNFRMNRRFTALCRAEGFEPAIVNEAAEIALVHKLAEKRIGIGLSLDFACADMPSPSLRTVGIDAPGFVWDIWLAVGRNRPLSEAADRFARRVTAHCREDATRSG